MIRLKPVVVQLGVVWVFRPTDAVMQHTWRDTGKSRGYVGSGGGRLAAIT